MMKSFPSLFISHGMPVMAILPTPTHHFLINLGKKLGHPKAIVCVSAHWETVSPMLSGADYPETIHDFYGFPQQLYEITYPAPGNPSLASRITEIFSEHGIASKIDMDKGFDHGAWVPMCLMYPEAEIPVIQLSIQCDLGPNHHFQMGKALSRLRGEGVLIMGSGGATHNLEDIHGRKMHDQPLQYAINFDAWLEKTILKGDIPSLLDYKRQGPDAEKNHPYPSEHFIPLFVPLGAAEDTGKGELIHKEFIYGILSLAAYIWR
ncbi:MAG: dioxygenase [Desulfobacterales bacterium]|nr:dioxygenase [Desulfobacterales bacterium]